jgi:hypothetical protein
MAAANASALAEIFIDFLPLKSLDSILRAYDSRLAIASRGVSSAPPKKLPARIDRGAHRQGRNRRAGMAAGLGARRSGTPKSQRSSPEKPQKSLAAGQPIRGFRSRG